MKTIYNVDYFIKKFEAIPSSCIGESQDTGCAYGQCRTNDNFNGASTAEGIALTKVMQVLLPLTIHCGMYPPELSTPARINNGETKEYQQATPKERLLAALYDIYEKTYGRKYGEQEQPKEKIIYKTVVIDSKVKELQETLNEN